MKKIAFLLLLLFLIYCPKGQSQTLENYQQRRAWLLKGLANIKVDGAGKHGLPRALARLWNYRYDPTAIQYICHVLDMSGQSLFDFPGMALAICKFKSSFTPAQLIQIRQQLEPLAKIGRNGGKGEGFLGHGTENQALMSWCSAYLLAQEFPEAKWANGMNSGQLQTDMKERLRKTFKNIYHKGYTEYLSTTYEVVMDVPVLYLYEFAKDKEVKAIAEAYLLYKWSILALNNFEGLIMAPYGRMNTQQDFRPNSTDVKYAAASSFYSWLLWGWGQNTDQVTRDLFSKQSETTYTIYAALSEVAPPALFFALANGEGVPYTARSAAPSFGQYGNERARPRLMLRKVYRAKNFSLGTGNLRWYPGGDYADFNINMFSLAWRSNKRYNYISCLSPYWYGGGSDTTRGPNTWDMGNSSPFEQIAQHQHSAIVLFNIPKKDPWKGMPEKRIWAWRSNRGDQLWQRAMVRIPESVDALIERQNWIFLSAEGTYIGIRPLNKYYWDHQTKGWGVDGFKVLKSDFGRTGFVFEVGDAAMYENFDAFQQKLLVTHIETNWNNMTVSYINPQKESLSMQFNTGLKVDPDGLANAVPLVRVQGKKELDYREWPLISSPQIQMDQGVLTIKGKGGTIKVDWTDGYPDILQSTTNI